MTTTTKKAARIPWAHKQKFPGFQIPDYLTWDESKGTFVGLGTGDYLSPGGWGWGEGGGVGAKQGEI